MYVQPHKQDYYQQQQQQQNNIKQKEIKHTLILTKQNTKLFQIQINVVYERVCVYVYMYCRGMC